MICISLLFAGCAKEPAMNTLVDQIEPAIYEVGELLPQFEVSYERNEFSFYYNDSHIQLEVLSKDFPLEESTTFRFFEKKEEDGKEYYLFNGGISVDAVDENGEEYGYEVPTTDIYFYEGDYLFHFYKSDASLTFAETQDILHGMDISSFEDLSHTLVANGDRADYKFSAFFYFELTPDTGYPKYACFVPYSVRKEAQGIEYLTSTEENLSVENFLIGNTERGIMTVTVMVNQMNEPVVTAEEMAYLGYPLLEDLAEHFGTKLIDMPE